MSCGLSGLHGFGSRTSANRAMRLHHKKGISLKAAWRQVKSGKRHRSVRKHKRGIKRSGKKNGGRRRRRSFGSCGPGYNSGNPAIYSSYFGNAQPFITPPEYYLPQVNGKIQSPQMLYT